MRDKQIIDQFGRVHDYLRISLTDKCNFRCVYCMPNEKMKFAPNASLMTADEIFNLASTFVDMGINKIRFTGGEPLLRSDSANIIESVAKLPVKLAITTNGYFIHEYTDLFKRINLNSINLSIDSLNEQKFNSITQRDHFQQVNRNIKMLEETGFHVKLNCVVMKNFNEDEILDFVELTRERNLHVRFIEFMPFKNNQWERDKVFGYKDIMGKIESSFRVEKLQDKKNDTAKNFRINEGVGTFAVISTITAPFCQDCNRIRLTATGKLRNCLFAKNESDLLTALRNGEDVEKMIHANFINKHEKFGGWEDFESKSESYDSGRSMISIGG